MKTRDLVFGIFALVFAIGSAFASFATTAISYQIRAKEGPVSGGSGCPGQAETMFKCLDVSASEECSGQDFNCRVTVQNAQGLVGDTNLLDTSCATQSNSSDEAVTSILESCVIDVQ